MLICRIGHSWWLRVELKRGPKRRREAMGEIDYIGTSYQKERLILPTVASFHSNCYFYWQNQNSTHFIPAVFRVRIPRVRMKTQLILHKLTLGSTNRLRTIEKPEDERWRTRNDHRAVIKEEEGEEEEGKRLGNKKEQKIKRKNNNGVGSSYKDVEDVKWLLFSVLSSNARRATSACRLR